MRPARVLALAVLVGLMGASARASAERPDPTVAGRARHEQRALDRAPREAEALPRLLAQLPKSTPAAIWVPNVDVALADLDAALDLLHLVQPEVGRRRAGAVLASLLTARAPISEALYGSADRSDEERERWAELATPAGLARVGIDVGGSAVLVPSANDDALLLAFELTNRPRFEAWLATLAGSEPRRVAVGAERASVIEPANAPAVAFLSRQSVAYCQLGESTGSDPIALLRAAVAFAPPLLAQSPGLVRAFQRLPDEAHAYALVSPEPAARLAIRAITSRREKDLRFEAPDKRRSTEHETAALVQRVRRAAEGVDGVAIALVPRRDRLVLRAELALSDRGAKLLRERMPPASTASEPIARWAETPALARLLLRMKGDDAERLATSLGIALPSSSLTGTIGLLVFGVDPECPLARRDRDTDGLGWAFLVPSAVAVGLKGSSADAVHRALGRTLAATNDGPAGDAASRDRTQSAEASPTEPVAKVRGAISGHAYGSTYEVRVFDDLVLAGAGPGSGAAAMRRMSALPPPRRAAEDGVPLAEGAIHLRAIDAALDAGGFPAESRRELVLLEHLRKRLRPLLEQVDGVSFELRAVEPERRLRIDVAVER